VEAVDRSGRNTKGKQLMDDLGKRNAEITPLRLIVDPAKALKDDEALEDVSSWNMEMLNMWSKRTKVKYPLLVSENQDLAPVRQLVLDSNGRHSHEEENEDEVPLPEIISIQMNHCCSV